MSQVHPCSGIIRVSYPGSELVPVSDPSLGVRLSGILLAEKAPQFLQVPKEPKPRDAAAC